MENIPQEVIIVFSIFIPFLINQIKQLFPNVTPFYITMGFFAILGCVWYGIDMLTPNEVKQNIIKHLTAIFAVSTTIYNLFLKNNNGKYNK